MVKVMVSIVILEREMPSLVENMKGVMIIDTNYEKQSYNHFLLYGFEEFMNKSFRFSN